MNRNRLILIIVSVVVVILLGGLGIWYLRSRPVDGGYVAPTGSTTTRAAPAATTPSESSEVIITQTEPQGQKQMEGTPEEIAERLRQRFPEPPPEAATPTSSAETPPSEPPASTALLDPDNDGLTNLQEEQLGSNPNNADSDGDGYKDGDEVKAGYNPVGPGKISQ